MNVTLFRVFLEKPCVQHLVEKLSSTISHAFVSRFCWHFGGFELHQLFPFVLTCAQRFSPDRYAVIAFGCASCPKITCGRDGCGTEFCYHCKQLWHPNQTCDAARQQRAQSLRLRTVRSSSLSHSQESGAAGKVNLCAATYRQ